MGRSQHLASFNLDMTGLSVYLNTTSNGFGERDRLESPEGATKMFMRILGVWVIRFGVLDEEHTAKSPDNHRTIPERSRD